MQLEGLDEEDIKLVFKNKVVDMRSWYLFFSVVFILVGLFFKNYHSLIFAVGLVIAYLNEEKKFKKS